jgi:hypothetical protein
MQVNGARGQEARSLLIGKPMRRSLLLLVFGATLIACGCEKQIFRGAQDPSWDEPAMSLGLDKDDVQRALKRVLDRLRSSALMNTWRRDRGQDTVALAYFRNDTGQDVDQQLEAMLSETETWLVQSRAVTMIARDQPFAITRQASDAPFFRFQARDDDARLAQFGRQRGVKYYVTGKLQSSDETWQETHRIQYWVFLQILESDTGAIRFQEKAEVTKVMD